MLRSRSCRGVVCLAASLLVFPQGCYYYAPAQLPLASGSEVRVDGTAIELHEGSMIRPLVADAQSTSVGVRKFSGAKTALSVIGISVVVALAGTALVLHSDNSVRSAPALGGGR